MTTIDHLPAELIHQIADYISHRDVFNFAQLSRRLNSLLIPYIFTVRHHTQDPSHTKHLTMRVSCYAMSRNLSPVWKGSRTPVSTEGWKDILSALTIAFDLQELDTLECMFTCLSSQDHIDWDTFNYRRLLLALQRLKRVRVVKLALDHSNVFAPHKERAFQTMEHRQRITNELLDTCLEKGCENLVVQGSSFLPPVPTKRQMTYARILRRFWPSSLVWLTHPFSTAICQPLFLPPNTRQASKLVHLQIWSLVLLWPPFSTWTYDVLGTPSLTSLTLNMVYLESDLWEFVLSWIVQPLQTKLVNLTIGDCNIPAPILVDFIAKLRALTHLTLSECLPPSNEVSVTPTNLFPNLTSLTAPADWVQFVLKHSGPKSKAKLKFLCLIPPPTFSLDTFASDLKAIHNTLPSSPPDPHAHLDISLDLSHGQYSIDALQEDFNAYHSSDFTLNEKGIRVFSGYNAVTELRLPVDMIPYLNPKTFAPFLGGWARLKSVTFCDPFERTERYLYLSPWTPKKRDHAKEKVVQDILSRTRILCPSVEIVAILNGG